MTKSSCRPALGSDMVSVPMTGGVGKGRLDRWRAGTTLGLHTFDTDFANLNRSASSVEWRLGGL